MQLYGVGWLCGYMVSVDFAAIWCRLILQLYDVSSLCSYMVSDGCAAICCLLVV